MKSGDSWSTTAVEMSKCNFGFQVANYDFCDCGKAGQSAHDADSNLIRLELGDEVGAKTSCGQGDTELAGEVEAAFQEFGQSGFRVWSVFRPVSAASKNPLEMPNLSTRPTAKSRCGRLLQTGDSP